MGGVIWAFFLLQNIETLNSSKKDPFSLNSFEITDRKTEKENRKDTVWITCELSNDILRTNIELIMCYELFNDEWKIVDSEVLRDSAIPLASSITESDVKKNFLMKNMKI